MEGLLRAKSRQRRRRQQRQVARGSGERAGPGGLNCSTCTAGVEMTWTPAKGVGFEWADIPASRGRDDANASFGSVVLPFFSDT